MKPMIILPPNTMGVDDINLLRENGICVVEADDPAKVRFMDPIPAQSSRDQIEMTAIKFSRLLLNQQWFRYYNNGPSELGTKDFAYLFMMLLKEGNALDARGTTEEREEQAYVEAHLDEVRRLAREDARAERAAKKAAASKQIADKK